MSGIAEIFQATLSPTKSDLLSTWVPEQPWFSGTTDDLEIVADYRFVDPAGEVGIESFILCSAGEYYHLPLTYRGAEFPGAQARLITTMDHSVLGDRWVYDATTDPVYLAELRRVICAADTAAENHYVDRGRTEQPLVEVRGGGPRSTASAPGRLTFLHKLTLITAQTSVDQAPAGALVGAWRHQDRMLSAVFALLR